MMQFVLLCIIFLWFIFKVVESKELHEKIINISGSVTLYNEEQDKKEVD